MKYPNEKMSPTEKYIYLKAIEKEVKEELELIKIQVKEEIESTENDYFRNENGSVQRVVKVSKKPKDSLKIYLHDLGLLELCKKDDIDMNKVKEMIEAGVIDEEEVEEHLLKVESEYLKFKPYKEDKK